MKRKHSGDQEDDRSAKKPKLTNPLGIPSFTGQHPNLFKLEMGFLSILDVLGRVLVLSKSLHQLGQLWLDGRFEMAKKRDAKFDPNLFIEMLKKLQRRRIYPLRGDTETEQAAYLYLSMHTPGVFIEEPDSDSEQDTEEVKSTQKTPETVLKQELRAKAKLIYRNTIFLQGPSLSPWLVEDVLPMMAAVSPSRHKQLIVNVYSAARIGLSDRPILIEFIILNPGAVNQEDKIHFYSLSHNGRLPENRCWRPTRSGEFKMMDDDPIWSIDDNLSFTDYPNTMNPFEWDVDFNDIRGPVLHVDNTHSTMQCDDVDKIKAWKPLKGPVGDSTINDIVGTDQDFAQGELFSSANLYHILFSPGMDVRALVV